MLFGRILAIFLSIFLCLPIAWADDEEDEQLKKEIVQVVKEHETEIFAEAMSEFNNMDTNDDGYVSLVEFIRFESYGSIDQKEQVYKAMDANHDGKLTQQELWLFIHHRMKVLK